MRNKILVFNYFIFIYNHIVYCINNKKSVTENSEPPAVLKIHMPGIFSSGRISAPCNCPCQEQICFLRCQAQHFSVEKEYSSERFRQDLRFHEPTPGEFCFCQPITMIHCGRTLLRQSLQSYRCSRRRTRNKTGRE